MYIRIKHTDKSGLQYFDVNQCVTPKQANDYITYIDRMYGNPPYQMIVENVTIRERKNFKQPSIMYM
jgi:hypothetical protein